MRRVSSGVLVALGLAVAASCGGSAFTSGGGADAGDDGAAPAEASGDAPGPVDTSSGGGDTSSADAHGGDGGGKDAPSEAPGADARPDVVDEPPPTCAGGFACVPAVPQGWTGPVELYAGSKPAPPCTADFASSYDGNDQLSAPDATCSCSCNASPTQCGTPSLSFFATAVCAAGTSCYSANLPPSVCTTVNDTTGCGVGVGSPRMTASGSPVLGATCSPQPGRQVPPPTWGTHAQACSSTTAVVQVDCLAGSVCAPKPAAPYGKTLCVFQAGDVSCPGLGYSSKQLFYGAVNDQRTCTDCTCGALTGASCGAKLDTFSTSDGSCGGLPISYAAPFSCDPVGQPADFRLTVTSQNGSCAANPTGPTGTATPASPTTFCCLP